MDDVNLLEKMQSVDDGKLGLIIDNEVITFELANINKANLVIEF